ncbi:MAG: response regulator transcription factor [Chloroflexi bacterium]|nr:response regulator transcription factor [Chloroflexota bacterium]
MRILVVEDTPKMAGLLRRGLTEEGYAVDVVGTGVDAVWLATEQSFDAIVLDVVLPDIDGFEVCRRLRREHRWAPLLMLTAKDDVSDRVRGLDSGADDYLTKPFAFEELFARVRSLVRRGPHERSPVLEVGDLALDPAEHSVRRGDRLVDLTPREFALLHYLMQHPREALTRARLLEHVWDFAFEGDPNIVDVYIGYLRDKIDRPFKRASVETVRGVGYRLRNESDDARPA